MRARNPLLMCLLLASSLPLLSGGCSGRQPVTPPGADSAAATEATNSPFRPATSKDSAQDINVVKQANQRLAESAQAQRAKWAGKTFDEFERATYKEPGVGGKYIVNGDTPILDRKHLQEFFETRIKPHETELIIAVNNGVEAKWNSTDQKHLTYCVSHGFGSHQDRVIAAMEEAAAAWQRVADVAYSHVTAEDGTCGASNAHVVFDVRPVNVGGEYLARAFFPDEPRGARNVLIDDSSFRLDPNAKLQLAGILRHELGHTLGFRHEHTRPEAGTCFEDNDWKPLTDYDKFSVMHYPQCNGGGDWSLTLTPKDDSGVACVYGAANGFQIDPTLVANFPQCVSTTGVPPIAPGTTGTKVFKDQRVAKNQKKNYASLAVSPGTRVDVMMIGHGTSPGDPDLYVRFGKAPDLGPNKYNCRPYLDGATETCSLDVPAGTTKVFVMVHGYEKGRYDLKVVRSVPS